MSCKTDSCRCGWRLVAAAPHPLRHREAIWHDCGMGEIVDTQIVNVPGWVAFVTQTSLRRALIAVPDRDAP